MTIQPIGDTRRSIHTEHTYLSYIDCLPDEHIIGYCYDLVPHMVQVAIQCSKEPESRTVFSIGHSHIVLIGNLGFQVRTPIMEEIILIECRDSEYILIRSPDEQVLPPQQLV